MRQKWFHVSERVWLIKSFLANVWTFLNWFDITDISFKKYNVRWHFTRFLDQMWVLSSRFWQKNRYILQVDFIEPKSNIKSVPESPWTLLYHEVNIPCHFTNIFYGSKNKFWGGCLSHAVQMTSFLSPIL